MAREHNVQQQPRPKRRRKPFRALLRGFAMLVMIGIITGCIVASVMTVYVINTLDLGDSVVLEDVKLSFSTIIYALDEKDGSYVEIQKVQTNENRIWVNYEDIPQAVKDAAIAVEDKRFWQHSGIDLKRTAHAALNYLNPFRDESFGGSTITQQVIKNVTNDNAFRVDRKLREIFRAINLEKNYSKEQILEVYLNTIALGNGQNGVQSAAQLYFGKDVKDLTIAESASLIAITQNPTKWDPFRNPENNKKRQQDILYFMSNQQHRDGTPMLTPEEFKAALDEEMVFMQDDYRKSQDSVQNWFVDALYEDVLADLVERAGYTEKGAWEALKSGGFRIYSTVDIEMQEFLEKKYLDPATFPPIRNEEYPESAFVILDFNGEVKALVGSNRKKTGARLFNRATSAVRHPGSTIKPLSSYSLAMERDMIHWSMLWDDHPILLDPNDETSVYPKNFYVNPPYLGMIPVKEAIQRSTNTIPVKLVQLLEPRTSFEFLKNSLGFHNLVESQMVGGKIMTDVALAPMALGAMTGGVTPLELAAGYQIFGNGGLYNRPHTYTKVLDADGSVILENKIVPTRVISAETATVMNRLLQQVTNSAPGTGRPAKFSDMPIAGKTGTSDNDYNQWFCGVTPYYVGVCWLGYNEMETIDYRGYYYPPPLIWKNIMAPIHATLPVKGFEAWGDVVELEYCVESGELATEDCPTKALGWYKPSNQPPSCSIHGDTRNPEEDDFWSWLYDDDDENSSSSREPIYRFE